MKKVLNLLLAVTIVGLGYICYRSIMGPIGFEETSVLHRWSIATS